jgi:tripartite-type tricarboxylate transporter receptor subunit TctC
MKSHDSCRRTLLAALGAAAVGAPFALARAQAPWPAKPIRIMHGFDGGSNPDTVSRVIGPGLGERLGQPVVVESRPGAGGRIATGFVATQPADGYTLIMLTAGDGVVAATDPKLPYDLSRDYSFITTVIQFPFLLLVNASSPFQNLADALAAARRDPGKLTFGTPGLRTTQHLVGELIKTSANVDLTHVPFKGTAFADLLGGRVDFLVAAPAVATPQIKAGKVRAITVTSREPMSTFPDVRPVAETLPGFEVTSWLGLAAPAGTPQPIVDRLASEVRRVLAVDDVRARLLATGSDVTPSTPQEFRSRVEADIRKWKALAERAKLD